MKTRPIQQTSGIRYALQRARALNSEDYKSFMAQLDKWTKVELEKIEAKKYPKLEKEAAIDMVFFHRENEIAKKQKDMLPKRDNCFVILLRNLGLV